MSPDLLNSLLNPSAPVPAGWPTGIFGVFLIFLVPIGGGIPLGVVMGRDIGLSPLIMAVLYVLSDVGTAVFWEPFVVLARAATRRSRFLGRIAQRLQSSANRVGLADAGSRGAIGLILLSFAIDPMTGRAAAAAAGRGPIEGWTFAIIGDLGYFLILMASTLWLAGIVDDERVVIGAAVLLSWLAPILLRRAHSRLGPRPQLDEAYVKDAA